MTLGLRKFNRRPYFIAIGLASLLSILPLLLAWSGEWVAATFDCRIGSGPPETCMIAGIDWGYALNWTFVVGWAIFLTFPVAFVIIIVLLITMAIHHWVWKRKQA